MAHRCSGRSFHALGAASLKARSPNFRRVLRTCRSDFVADRGWSCYDAMKTIFMLWQSMKWNWLTSGKASNTELTIVSSNIPEFSPRISLASMILFALAEWSVHMALGSDHLSIVVMPLMETSFQWSERRNSWKPYGTTWPLKLKLHCENSKSLMLLMLRRDGDRSWTLNKAHKHCVPLGRIKQVISGFPTAVAKLARERHRPPVSTTLVRILLDGNSNILTEEEDRKQEENHIHTTLTRCGNPDWSIKRVKRQMETVKQKKVNRKAATQFPEINRTTVLLPYVHGLSEAITRAYRWHGISSVMKPFRTIRSLLVHPKDKRRQQDVCECVYKIYTM